ncbi:hypothetical protein Mucpa_5464 [Mucilaginibacter paludis DSM 18603]|uniref:Uncharacterized protein n=1 Tax=Mucilaginibacter paludis DSM 18603 TaxID=714943 RepID=H1YAS7_9SPHI|nr:hypothetical protein Mucpa_5464 [Mucilaginibacter paludis DSM 18603]
MRILILIASSGWSTNRINRLIIYRPRMYQIDALTGENQKTPAIGWQGFLFYKLILIG